MSRLTERHALPRLATVTVLALLCVGLTAGVAWAAAPTITSFSPTSGSVGTFVTIKGTSFTGTTSVKFFNNKTAPFTVDSDVQITAVVPSGASTGPISVTTPGGTATSSTDFVVGNPPTITSFSPTSGSVGTFVTIKGTSFTGTTSVKFFNNKTAPFIIDSDTQITAVVPSGVATGPIMVTTPIGSTTSAASFTVIPAGFPTITSFSPTFGPVGTVVSISGTNFTGTTQVKFNNKSATFSVNSDTQITATVANGSQSGPIFVTNAVGTAQSAASFTVGTAPAAPKITSFSPTSGSLGTTVTINGSGFTGVTQVKFNLTSASFTFDTDVKITTTVPNGATTGPISVTTPGGTATSSTAFVVPGTPTVDAFSPASGPWGAQVTITGQSYSDVSAVRFNGLSASFTINSSSQVTATVPTGATTGPISVTNSKGTAISADLFTVKHVRSVSLSLTGSLLASGSVTVADGTTACISGVPVQIQRRVSGSWRIVGTTTTGASGSYAVAVADREGKYRAKAPKVFLANGDVCTRARSDVVFNG